MKNKKNLFAILAITLALTLVFAMAACGNGSTGAPTDPTSTVLEGMDGDNNFYKLEITKASGRAVYTPQNGDSYVLTITFANGTTNTSKGTVSGKNGGELQLKPDNSDTKFTVKTESGLMTGITGTITTTDGNTKTPASIVPAKSYDDGWKLTAFSYDDGGGRGQSWSSGIYLSEFTLHRPKYGDTFKFYISGTTDKPMKRFGLTLSSHNSDWSKYQWIGGSETINIPAGKLERTFEITIKDTVDDYPGVIYSLSIGNNLWQEDINGNLFNGDKADSLPAGYKINETVMATIKDFKICLLKVE
jgi:hypothetical protein